MMEVCNTLSVDDYRNCKVLLNNSLETVVDMLLKKVDSNLICQNVINCSTLSNLSQVHNIFDGTAFKENLFYKNAKTNSITSGECRSCMYLFDVLYFHIGQNNTNV